MITLYVIRGSIYPVMGLIDKGSDAMKYEKDILEKNKEYAYVGPTPFIGNTGITECFSIDIYKLHMRNDNE